MESIYQNNSTILEKSSSENLSPILTEIKKPNNIGGEYLFNESGLLKEYKFYTGDNYTYAEYYDQKGKIEKSEGIPLVATNIEEVNFDSISINSYFFTFNKKITSIYLIINTSDTITASQSDSKAFSYVLHYKTGYNTKGVSELRIKTLIKYNDCKRKEFAITDSLYINRIPSS